MQSLFIILTTCSFKIALSRVSLVFVVTRGLGQSANATYQDGRYFQHVARLLAAYSEKVGPLETLRLEDGVLCAPDRNGVLVVPVSFDYAIWTEIVAQRVDAVAGLVRSDQKIKRAEIWTDGKLFRSEVG